MERLSEATAQSLHSEFHMTDGRVINIRPIQPDDAVLEQDFIKTLSPESMYFRFLSIFREFSDADLKRLTHPDPDSEFSLVATIEKDGSTPAVGFANYSATPNTDVCEFAIVIADAWSGSGIACHLMNVIIAYARSRGLRVMYGDVLSDNKRMLHFVSKFGFRTTTHPDDDGLRRAVLPLTP